LVEKYQEMGESAFTDANWIKTFQGTGLSSVANALKNNEDTLDFVRSLSQKVSTTQIYAQANAENTL
jgi:hypothetical protein